MKDVMLRFGNIVVAPSKDKYFLAYVRKFWLTIADYCVGSV